jgi:hypothetical protein
MKPPNRFENENMSLVQEMQDREDVVFTRRTSCMGTPPATKCLALEQQKESISVAETARPVPQIAYMSARSRVKEG